MSKSNVKSPLAFYSAKKWLSSYSFVICSPTQNAKVGFIVRLTSLHEKVQVGNDKEKAQSERNSHSKNRGGKN